MNEPQRIVSLLPGATEWVCQLGLADRLVGVSHECDYPTLVQSLPRVTRSRVHIDQSSREIDASVRAHSETRTPLYELVASELERLQPDLILTQSLCNVCAVSERDVLEFSAGLSAPCRVLDLPAQTFDDVIGDARAIAEATGNNDSSLIAIESIQQRIVSVRQRSEYSSQNVTAVRVPKVTLLEWTDPLFCSGHWTPELIRWAGGIDPIGVAGRPSREMPFETLAEADPDILLVACCGMSHQRSRDELAMLQKREGWTQLSIAKSNQVHVFDGSAFFNRPGPRLVDTLEHVAEIVQRWQSNA